MAPRGSPATRGRNVNGQQVYDDDVIEAIEAEAEAEEAARAEEAVRGEGKWFCRFKGNCEFHQ